MNWFGDVTATNPTELDLEMAGFNIQHFYLIKLIYPVASPHVVLL